MRRLLLRFAFALTGLFLLSTKFIDITVGAGFGCHPAETAWAATGLAADRFSLDYWVTAPGDSGLGRGDLRKAAARLGARLGARKCLINAGTMQGVRFANLDGDLPGGGELILTVQAERAAVHIGVSCWYTRLPPGLSALARRLRVSLGEVSPTGEMAWTACGRHRGRLSPEAWRVMWARVLAAVGAVRRGDSPDDEPIEAYTPLLPPASTGAGAANLVMRADYDLARCATLVSMASPALRSPP